LTATCLRARDLYLATGLLQQAHRSEANRRSMQIHQARHE
jgi:hypothetical protein